MNEEETVEVEFAVFNRADVWEPLFAEGKMPESMRYLVNEPIHDSASLWTAYRFAYNTNEDRAHNDKIGEYGEVVVRKRTVTRTRWEDVTYEEIDAVRRA